MAKRVIIVPYKMGSASAKALQQGLKEALPKKKVLRVRENSNKFNRRKSDFIINWGSSYIDWDSGVDISLNCWEYVVSAIDKIACLSELNYEGVSTVEFTTVKEVAQQWLQSGKTVVIRHTVVGHGGAGIEVVEGDTDLPDAPLYSLYKKKKHEYRVHVMCGEVIDVQWKRKERDVEVVDTKIRNRKNGWVFCREGIKEPNDLRDLAIKAIYALGLDFGAVDIIYNELEDKCYVLEVNTAPGLQGTTLQSYVNAFAEEINSDV